MHPKEYCQYYNINLNRPASLSYIIILKKVEVKMDNSFQNLQKLSLFDSNHNESEFHFENSYEIYLDKQRCLFGVNSFKDIGDADLLMSDFILSNPVAASSQLKTVQQPLMEEISRVESKESGVKRKKIKKNEYSPFHNYQKHLNNALKKIIVVPMFENNQCLFKLAASQIWQTYQLSQVKTKRILQIIFNEKNGKASDAELRIYGFWETFNKYGEQVINEARSYLCKLALDQIETDNIYGYLRTTRLKCKDGFKDYIIGFRSELQTGYLKRRIYVDKPLS